MKNLLLILSFGLTLISFGQSVAFDKKNFDDKKGLRDAENNIKDADRFMGMIPRPNYKAALPLYESANKFNPNNDYVNFQIGLCYLHTNFKFKALDFFLKSFKLNANHRADIHFYIGRGYQLQMNWDKAIQHYELHKQRLDQKRQAVELMEINKLIYECNSGRKLVQNPVRVWIDNLGESVNTEYPEYGMMIPQMPQKSILQVEDRLQQVVE